jgi:hypothetical protein
VFELAVHATLLSQTVVTVHHFRAKSDSSGGTDAETLATDWRDNLKTAWLAGKSNNYTINRLSVRSVDPTPGDQVYEVFLTSANTGSSGDSPASPQLALVISWRSTQAGRKHRGRTYVPGLPDSQENNGTWNSSVRTNASDYADDMLERYGSTETDTNFDFGIFTRAKPITYSIDRLTGEITTHPAYSAGWTNISGYLVRSIVYTQRRRTLGVGT